MLDKQKLPIYILDKINKRMIVLPSAKIEYINKTAFELISLITKHKRNVVSEMPSKGSIAELPCIDLGEVGNLVFGNLTYSGKRLNIGMSEKDYDHIISEADYVKVEKLVMSVVSNVEIQNIASESFVREQLHKWLFNTYNQASATQNFHDFLLSILDEEVKEYQVLIPIDKINIEKFISVGGTRIFYYTQKELEILDKKFKDKYDGKESIYRRDKNKWLGVVFCSCVVKAESVKAQMLAFEIQSSAIDVLMVTSETLDFPEFELSFDLNSRVTRNQVATNYLLQDSDPLKVTIQSKFTPPKVIINEEYYKRMLGRNFETFDLFLKDPRAKSTELGKLITNALRSLARALSNPDLHQRVAQIFTTIESLLLAGSESPILESLRKYCSRIVTKDPEMRQRVSTMLSSMYKVRSEVVHHAKKRDFDMADLTFLQRTANWLCSNLIKKLDFHTTKRSVLKEIDDAINAAG